jgi:predicted nucleic acid-binding protein
VSAVVVDTSCWIVWLAGKPVRSIDEALDEGRLWVPAVVAAELLSGRMSAANRRDLEAMLADLPSCGTDLAHWFRVGRLRASLLARGVTISTPDAHVAQCALDLGADLVTEDRVFRLVARHAPLRLG